MTIYYVTFKRDGLNHREVHDSLTDANDAARMLRSRYGIAARVALAPHSK